MLKHQLKYQLTQNLKLKKLTSTMILGGMISASGLPAGVLAQSSEQISEVLVTASRREESLQDTALSISAVDATALEKANISNAVDLQNVVPGMTISQGGSTTGAYIRGVGSFGTNATASSAISWNLNAVPIARPAGIGPVFFDLDRVEVLKGPQGTLYGKNASGGAINLITTRPDFEFGGYARLDAGNYDLRRFTGAVDLPASDTLAFRAATQVTRRDGYLSDGYNDQDSDSMRISALWEPNADLSATVIGEWTQLGGQGYATVPTSTFLPMPDDPWTGPSDASLKTFNETIGGTPTADDGYLDNHIKALSAEIVYDMDWGQMTFIPAVRDMDNDIRTYTPGFRYDQKETSKQTSAELRFSGDNGQLAWVAGYFYLRDEQTQQYELFALPIQHTRNDISLTTESQALFGEATYRLSDSFRLIGGLRYSEDAKGQDGVQTSYVGSDFVPPYDISGEVPAFGRRHDEVTDWKVGAEWDVAPDNMLFFTASTGFLSGGFFPNIYYPENTYEPEHMTAFTLGSKNLFLDRRLQANFELFYWDYEDKQERYLGATSTGLTGLLITNAGQAEIYGLEVDLEWQATPNDIFRFNTTIMDSEYEEFNYDSFSPTGAPLYHGCALGAPQPAPNPPGAIFQNVDCQGMPLVRAPDVTGAASYEHVFLLQDGGQLSVDVSAQFASEQYTSADFIEATRDDGYVTWNANLTWEPNDSWYLRLWGRNLSEEVVYTGGTKYPFNGPMDPSMSYLDIRDPRTYGVTAALQF